MARGEWGTPAGAFIFIHVVREGWGIIKIKTACRRRRQTEAVCLKDPPYQIMFYIFTSVATPLRIWYQTSYQLFDSSFVFTHDVDSWTRDTYNHVEATSLFMGWSRLAMFYLAEVGTPWIYQRGSQIYKHDLRVRA